MFYVLCFVLFCQRVKGVLIGCVDRIVRYVTLCYLPTHLGVEERGEAVSDDLLHEDHLVGSTMRGNHLWEVVREQTWGQNMEVRHGLVTEVSHGV